MAARNWPLLALLAAAAILASPLARVAMPGMPDYPARLASFFLIGGGPSPFYHIHWMAVPNLASEILVPLFAKAMSLPAAANLFLALGIAMWVLGGGLLHYALYRRVGLAPLAGAFFAYNDNLLWGFLNYYFAAGLAVVIFALWVLTAGSAKPARLAGFALAVTILYFSHVFAAAVLLMMLAGFETVRAGGDFGTLLRKAAAVAIVFLPSAFFFLFFRPSGGGGSVEFNLADTMLDRFESLIGHSFDHPAYALPIALLTIWLVAMVTRRASVARDMKLVLGLLLAAALLAPEWAMGGWAVHLRLPAFFCTVLFAATEFRFGPRLSAALAAAALVLMGWNAQTLARSWQGYDRQFAEFRAALSPLPRERRLLMVLDGEAIGQDSDQPYWHMGEYAIIDKADMTQLMFTTRGQHVVQLNPPLQSYAAADAQQGSPPDIGELDSLAAGEIDGDPDIRDIFPYLLRFQCHYDEAVVVRINGAPSPAPAMLRLLHHGSFFDLYAIRPDGSCRR